jgi:hypothetical protein
MEGWTNADAVFLRYSSKGVVVNPGEESEQRIERRTSLFQVKCALLALFGKDIPIVSFKLKIENYINVSLPL